VPSTTNLGLPYPSLSNAPNVPQDIQALAAQVEAKFASGWTALTVASGYTNYTGVTGPVPAYRVVGTRCHVSFWIQKTSGSFTINTEVVPFAAGALPSGIRPSTRSALAWGVTQWNSTTAPLLRVEAKIDGSISVNPAQSGTAPTWVMADFNFEINY
jgi:hypothetical protein